MLEKLKSLGQWVFSPKGLLCVGAAVAVVYALNNCV